MGCLWVRAVASAVVGAFGFFILSGLHDLIIIVLLAYVCALLFAIVD